MTSIVRGNLRIDMTDAHGAAVVRTIIEPRPPAARPRPVQQPPTSPIEPSGADAVPAGPDDPTGLADVVAGPDDPTGLADVVAGPDSLTGPADLVAGPGDGDDPFLPRTGAPVPAQRLSIAEAMRLLRQAVPQDLTSVQETDAERLCVAVDNGLLHLRQAAALVRQGGYTFAELAVAAEADAFALDQLSLNGLLGPERRVLALLAFAAGAMLPEVLIQRATDVAAGGQIAASLHRRGLVQQSAGRFGLPVRHAEDYQAILMGYLELAEAAQGIQGWLRQQEPDSPDARSAADAVVTVIGYAADCDDWKSVLRLALAVEPVLCLSGRWVGWREVIGRGTEAARATGDRAAEAYLTHQLGVLEFASDRLELAGLHWRYALRFREELDDQAGASRTRANLRLLALVAVKNTIPAHRWRRATGLASAAVIVLALLTMGYRSCDR